MSGKVKMLSLREQIMFTRNLGALLSAGIDLDAALRRLSSLLPKQSEKLAEMASQIASGRYLSQTCAGLLPEEIIAAIVVGEQSGKMAPVMFEIRDTLIMKERMRKTAKSLLKPAMMFLAGIIIFIGFVVAVIPTLAETSSKLQPRGRPIERGALMEFMVALSDLFRTSGPYMLALLVVLVGAVIFYARTPQGRMGVYSVVLRIPFLGDAIKNISFALWARYLALMWRAGYSDMPKAIGITVKSVPEVFREGIERYQADLNLGKGLGAACDPSRLDPSDPRCQWPIFLQVALQISEQTMETDDQLTTASNYLLEDAEATVNAMVEFSKMAVLVLVASSAALPIVAYLFEVVTMVGNTLSSSMR